MASIYTAKQAPIRGPYVKQAFAKSLYKGEDAWLQQRDVSVPASGGNASVDIFGVFDGHGGKQAAVYASKHMMSAVLSALDQHIGKDDEDTCENGMCIPTKHAPDAVVEVSAEEQLADCDVVKPEERALWRAQDAIVEAMPHALSDAFQKVEADFFEHTKVSGSTATVAALTGWEVVIANVGDSCAYLDTGGEVVLVSGNHRLDDNKVERARCVEAGREVVSSCLEGRPVGPLRVWPGGLAMSRTLGDHEAGAVVTAEPEVRQVTLPIGGGRLVLASDGLWDAVNPKTAMHHVRAMPASKAATELVQLALKSKGLRDDITVLVIDALPSEELRTPPALQRRNRQPIIARSAGAGSMSGEELMEAMSGGLTDQVTVLKPLEQSSHDAHWRRNVWERRLAAVQTTYGALLPAPSLTYSDMSTTIALSDAAMASSYEVASMMADETGDSSPNAASGDYLLFGSFDDVQEEDEWETVPTKSKGRKHGAEPDANMSAPPAKESRGADGLSSEGSGPLPPATEGGRAALQRGPGRPRGPPRERDGRRGRGHARGSAAARQQRMGE
ncbi:hypothetical protein WJX75_001295 [Coccomyxa subellipsoidea]|uniref:protein-serine/threonine phosphatase n=1 Tax=Coccomyxa subellipsoidea TaxID=248742 RepID=A0ABR2Z2C8_9CHLO